MKRLKRKTLLTCRRLHRACYCKDALTVDAVDTATKQSSHRWQYHDDQSHCKHHQRHLVESSQVSKYMFTHVLGNMDICYCAYVSSWTVTNQICCFLNYLVHFFLSWAAILPNYWQIWRLWTICYAATTALSNTLHFQKVCAY